MGWNQLSLLKKVALIMTCICSIVTFIGCILLFTGIECPIAVSLTFLVIGVILGVLSGFIWFVDFIINLSYW